VEALLLAVLLRGAGFPRTRGETGDAVAEVDHDGAPRALLWEDEDPSVEAETRSLDVAPCRRRKAILAAQADSVPHSGQEIQGDDKTSLFTVLRLLHLGEHGHRPVVCRHGKHLFRGAEVWYNHEHVPFFW